MTIYFKFPSGSVGHLTDDWFDQIPKGQVMPFFDGCGINGTAVLKKAEAKLLAYAITDAERKFKKINKRLRLLQRAILQMKSAPSINEFLDP